MCTNCVSNIDAMATALGGAAGVRFWAKARLEERRKRRGGELAHAVAPTTIRLPVPSCGALALRRPTAD